MRRGMEGRNAFKSCVELRDEKKGKVGEFRRMKKPVYGRNLFASQLNI